MGGTLIGGGEVLPAAQAAPRRRWLVLAGVTLAPVAIILAWRAFALVRPVPRLFQVFDTLVLFASVGVLVRGHRHLRDRDAVGRGGRTRR